MYGGDDYNGPFITEDELLKAEQYQKEKENHRHEEILRLRREIGYDKRKPRKSTVCTNYTPPKKKRK